MSLWLIDGKAKAGRPWGSEPRTDTPATVARFIAPTMTVAPRTAISTPGNRLLRLSNRITVSVPVPSISDVQFVLPANTAWMKPRISFNSPSASTENPKSAGSCPISTVNAMPFMYP